VKKPRKLQARERPSLRPAASCAGSRGRSASRQSGSWSLAADLAATNGHHDPQNLPQRGPSCAVGARGEQRAVARMVAQTRSARTGFSRYRFDGGPRHFYFTPRPFSKAECLPSAYIFSCGARLARARGQRLLVNQRGSSESFRDGDTKRMPHETVYEDAKEKGRSKTQLAASFSITSAARGDEIVADSARQSPPACPSSTEYDHGIDHVAAEGGWTHRRLLSAELSIFAWPVLARGMRLGNASDRRGRPSSRQRARLLPFR